MKSSKPNAQEIQIEKTLQLAFNFTANFVQNCKVILLFYFVLQKEDVEKTFKALIGAKEARGIPIGSNTPAELKDALG